MNQLLCLLTTFLLTGCVNSFALPSASVVSYMAYTSTSVTTSAYVTLVSSTSAAFSSIFACDTSGKFLKIAVGPVGAEVDLVGLPVSGCQTIESGKLVPANSRISIKALDATASTGGVMISGSR